MKVSVETLRCRLVVVGRHLQHAVGAEIARSLRVLDRGCRRVAACSCDDLSAAPSNFDGQSNHLLVFCFSHRGAFAGRAAGNQQTNAAADLSINQRAQALFINRAIGLEWCDQGRRTASHPINLRRHRSYPSFWNQSSRFDFLSSVRSAMFIVINRVRTELRRSEIFIPLLKGADPKI